MITKNVGVREEDVAQAFIDNDLDLYLTLACLFEKWPGKGALLDNTTPAGKLKAISMVRELLKFMEK